MNEAIAQFLSSACECFSNHDSDIAQQLCDSLTSLCNQSEADGVGPTPHTLAREATEIGSLPHTLMHEAAEIEPSEGLSGQDAYEVEPTRYSPRQVPACALLPDGASLSPQPCTRNLLACHQMLAWRHPGFGRLPPSLSDQLAVTELVGPDGMYAADNIRFGVLLQAGNVHYPVHQHAAEELYCVLQGTAGWGEHPNRLQRKPAGEFIHHRPFEPHCISTGSELLIALWGWAGEINSASYAVNSVQAH